MLNTSSAPPTLVRLQTLQASLESNQAVLLSNPTAVTYFSGFRMLVPEEREAFLLVTQSKTTIIQASFSPVVTSPAIAVRLGCYPEKLAQHLTAELASLANPVLHLDTADLRINEWRAVQRQVPATLADLDTSLVWGLTMIKQPTEIEACRQAGQVAKQALAAVLPNLKSGMTELDVQLLLEAALTTHGSERVAFPTIVAFGANGALPHHQPSTTPLTENSPVLIDFGATSGGFRSDMTRSFWFGASPTASYLKVEQAVKQAYQTAHTLLASHHQALVTAGAVDSAARSILQQHGYAQYFIHTTGHGIGRDIHEQPSLNSHNQTELTTNMVLTLEPGVYLEGQFGYRFENTILLTNTGCEELTA